MAAKKTTARATNAKNGPLHWELLEETYSVDAEPDGFTYRAGVPGGWLVAIWAGKDVNHHEWGGGLTFVPDPEHEWVVPTRAK